jgi:hypothetical protein
MASISGRIVNEHAGLCLSQSCSWHVMLQYLAPLPHGHACTPPVIPSVPLPQVPVFPQFEHDIFDILALLLSKVQKRVNLDAARYSEKAGEAGVVVACAMRHARAELCPMDLGGGGGGGWITRRRLEAVDLQFFQRFAAQAWPASHKLLSLLTSGTTRPLTCRNVRTHSKQKGAGVACSFPKPS